MLKIQSFALETVKSAFGSTRETRAALELAAAWGYVERDEQLLDALDRIAATLFRLAE